MFGVSLSLSFLLVFSVGCEVYFRDEFESFDKWTKGGSNVKDAASMELFERPYFPEESTKGIRSTKDSQFYHYSAPLDKEFDTKGKDLIFQYTLHHTQTLTCGGGYIKLLPKDYKDEFNGEKEYSIMFGPDACGHEKRIHLIFNYNGQNFLKRSDISYNLDSKAHVYTLILKKDKTYEVYVDEGLVASGTILDDWDLFGEKEIDDPNDKKPDDWVDEPEIEDKTAKKPEDWDQPEFITDTEATKPEDWSDEDDGEWTVPTKPNPDYKGEWKPPMIKNPDYKGQFTPKKIPNPDYKPSDVYADYKLVSLAVDWWQVESGSFVYSVLLTDDLEEAKTHRQKSVKFAEQVNKKQKEEEDAKAKADASKEVDAKDDDKDDEL